MPCLLDCPGLGIQDPEGLVLRDGQQRSPRLVKLNTPQVLLGDLQLLLQLISLIGIAANTLVKLNNMTHNVKELTRSGTI